MIKFIFTQMRKLHIHTFTQCVNFIFTQNVKLQKDEIYTLLLLLYTPLRKCVKVFFHAVVVTRIVLGKGNIGRKFQKIQFNEEWLCFYYFGFSIVRWHFCSRSPVPFGSLLTRDLCHIYVLFYFSKDTGVQQNLGRKVT